MSTNFDKNDLARLIALEHAFCGLALISAGNYAHLASVKPSEAVTRFRSAIESALYDSADTPKDVQTILRAHLHRMFDHVATMAKIADQGA